MKRWWILLLTGAGLVACQRAANPPPRTAPERAVAVPSSVDDDGETPGSDVVRLLSPGAGKRVRLGYRFAEEPTRLYASALFEPGALHFGEPARLDLAVSPVQTAEGIELSVQLERMRGLLGSWMRLEGDSLLYSFGSEGVLESFDGDVGEPTLRLLRRTANQLRGLLVPLPAEAVGVGARWQVRFAGEPPFRATMISEYTLLALAPNQITVVEEAHPESASELARAAMAWMREESRGLLDQVRRPVERFSDPELEQLRLEVEQEVEREQSAGKMLARLEAMCPRVWTLSHIRLDRFAPEVVSGCRRETPAATLVSAHGDPERGPAPIDLAPLAASLGHGGNLATTTAEALGVLRYAPAILVLRENLGHLEPAVRSACQQALTAVTGRGERLLQDFEDWTAAQTQFGQEASTLDALERALARPGLPAAERSELLIALARAKAKRNELEAAARAYDEALRIGASPEGVRSMALWLATVSDPRLRDLPRALRLISSTDASSLEPGDLVDTATIYAANNRFDVAILLLKTRLVARGQLTVGQRENIEARIEAYERRRLGSP